MVTLAARDCILSLHKDLWLLKVEEIQLVSAHDHFSAVSFLKTMFPIRLVEEIVL